MEISKLRDGTELDYKVGIELLECFKYSPYISDIFEAFDFMDQREEKLRMKRDSFYNYILQLKKKGIIPHNNHKSSKKKKYKRKQNRYDEGKGYYSKYSNYKPKEQPKYVKKEGWIFC